MAELDQRIEGILLQRLVQTIQLWCSEFDRTDDGDGRREPLVLRDITNKRRADKRAAKEEKVKCTFCSILMTANLYTSRLKDHSR